MRTIHMVDLLGQYRRISSEVDEAIHNVIESTSFIQGNAVKEFQKNLAACLGVKHVIGCANGTDALQVSLMALGLQAGDEVITPAFTFVATAEVIALLGLRPVMVDVDPHTFNIDAASLKKAMFHAAGRSTKTRYAAAAADCPHKTPLWHPPYAPIDSGGR